jgi:hypothetical protein
MDLMQFERIKTDLKQERYGLLKIQGPRCEDQELPGFELRKGRGIYIIMCINPKVILREVQGGFMCERGIFLGGFMEDCQDSGLDLGIRGKHGGLNRRCPSSFVSQRTGERGALPTGTGGWRRRRTSARELRPDGGEGRGEEGAPLEGLN